MRQLDVERDMQGPSEDYTELNGHRQAKRERRRLILVTCVFSAVVVGLAIWVGVLQAKLSKRSDSPSQPPSALAEEMLSNLNTSVNPCEDFYSYACGGWLSRATIPADRTSWSRTFQRLRSEMDSDLLDIAQANWPLLGPYHRTCMDQAAVDEAAADKLALVLQALEQNSTTVPELLRLAGEMARVGSAAFYRVSAWQDEKNTTVVAAHLSQSGLSLPDRDYYLQTALRNKYVPKLQTHIGRMLRMSGMDSAAAEQAAVDIVAFETRLAEVTMSSQDMHDTLKVYHKLTLAEVDAMAGLNFREYMAGLGLRPEQLHSGIIVDSPAFFRNVSDTLAAPDMPLLRLYLRWHVVHALTPALSTAMRNETSDFFDGVLRGQQQRTPRWRQCVSMANDHLRDLVGRLYVARRLAPVAKSMAADMLVTIQHAFNETLKTVTWMDADTRAVAQQKLHLMANKVGGPDEWESYAGLVVTTDSWFDNFVAASHFSLAMDLARVGELTDRSLWFSGAAVVNAFYEPTLNEMVFPAGILQPPFFNASFPPAVNYGGMGLVMGHELTHGFDADGRLFDPHGNLRSWWPPAVSAQYEERAQCMRDQYSRYEVRADDGTLIGHVNGDLTIDENIADNGGLRTSFSAFRKHEAEHGAQPLLRGYTTSQTFFLAYAQSWCTKIRPEAALVYLKTDPHSPAQWRVNGPVSNFEEFAKAFSCRAGTPLNPANKCVVW